VAGSRLMTELLREYDQERQAALRKRDARQAEMYRKLPRLYEIDRALSGGGIALAKAILHRVDAEAMAEKCRAESAALLAERAEILQKSDFPADYITNVFKCAACEDTGFVGQKKCACLTQRLVGKYYALSNPGLMPESECFDAFDFTFYSEETDSKTGISPRANMKRIWAASQNFVCNFGTDFENLLLHGETGLGKTFLCNCIARDMMDSGRTVLYTTAAQLFQMAERARFRRDEDDAPDEFLDLLMDVDLLMIDDLGTEFSTVLTSAELFRFVNTRLLQRRPTIISTNLAPADLETQYSDRVISRLIGGYTRLHFFGEDIRMQKRYRR